MGSLSSFANHSEKLTELTNQALKLQNYSATFFKNLPSEKQRPLHGKELTLLHKITYYYLSLDKKLRFLNQQSSISSEKILSHLQRIELYLKLFKPTYENKKIRRLMNDEDLSFNKKRNEIHARLIALFTPAEITNFKTQINSYLQNATSDASQVSLIRNHPAFQFIQKAQIDELHNNLNSILKSDLRHDRQVDRTNRISRDLGNAAGSVRWRKGHLLKEEKVFQEILAELKPLDIITEKTYFALTDKLIPGHFGHNAIWLGTKDQLKANGMWNHPSIVPHQKAIEKGQSILESDRSGTHLKSLRKFMNVDEFAILRINSVKSYTQFEVERAYKIALSQLGKVYDFNFDVETTDKIVCSELLYQAYQDIHWPTQAYLGRVTITPDNVTSLGLYNNSPIELVYYVAAKKKNQIKYKNLDNLAEDMKFVKIDGVYKKVIKKCPQRRSSQCTPEYQELNYEAHTYIEDFELNL